jgi:predicted MPP superfamily phosphohydrolase
MLEMGSRGRLHIREVVIPCGSRATLLYASDLHLSPWAAHVGQQLVEVVRTTQPDVVLLGGDMVDFESGLPLLASLICRLKTTSPIYAIPGNHDAYVGLDKVKRCVETAGAFWLKQVQLASGSIQVDATIHERCNHATFRILCAHDPADFPAARRCGYDLVLAGHLHGGQCILFERNKCWYPGRWFFRWNGSHFRENGTEMLVSRGMNDTLPLRWNCPREVIVCRLM